MVAIAPLPDVAHTLVKREISSAGLGVAIALPVVFCILSVPWLLRWAYLTMTHQEWEGCLQRVHTDSAPPSPRQRERPLPQNIPMLPTNSPQLDSAADLKGQEAYAPTSMDARSPESAPPDYKAQDGSPTPEKQ